MRRPLYPSCHRPSLWEVGARRPRATDLGSARSVLTTPPSGIRAWPLHHHPAREAHHPAGATDPPTDRLRRGRRVRSPRASRHVVRSIKETRYPALSAADAFLRHGPGARAAVGHTHGHFPGLMQGNGGISPKSGGGRSVPSQPGSFGSVHRSAGSLSTGIQYKRRSSNRSLSFNSSAISLRT